MNYSNKYKTVLLLPERQATRAIFTVFSTLGFVSNSPSKTVSHNLNIPSKYNSYGIISSIRNPYNRFISFLKWQDYMYSFEDWIYKPEEIVTITSTSMNVTYNRILEYHQQARISYYIDTENIKEDILNIPFVKEVFNNPLVKKNSSFIEHFDKLILTNSFTSEDKPIYYNLLQDYHEVIYNQTKPIFNIFGYNKDSWKDLIK